MVISKRLSRKANGAVMPDYAMATAALVLALGLTLVALGTAADFRARRSIETVEQPVPCGAGGNLVGDECL